MTAVSIHRPTNPARFPLIFLRELFAREGAFAAGALVLAMMMAPTMLAMALDDRLLNGVGVWDKVLKFEVSLAVYLATLAWFAGWLPAGMISGRFYRAYRVAVLGAIAAEFAWIGGAAANGVGSHFNVGTPLMAALYPIMGGLAVCLTSASLVYGVAIWRNAKSPLDPAFRLSVGLGLTLTFMLTLIVAGHMASTAGHWVGDIRTDAHGLSLIGWSRESGDLRVPHFFATHAMHFIPAFGYVAYRLFPPATGRRAIWGFAALFVLFVGYVFAQAISGRPFLAFLG